MDPGDLPRSIPEIRKRLKPIPETETEYNVYSATPRARRSFEAILKSQTVVKALPRPINPGIQAHLDNDPETPITPGSTFPEIWSFIDVGLLMSIEGFLCTRCAYIREDKPFTQYLFLRGLKECKDQRKQYYPVCLALLCFAQFSNFHGIGSAQEPVIS
jgi:hypothetical protein